MTIKTGNPFDPPARQLKPAIKFLRQLDVPAGRIAGALGETADNIRHLDSRVQYDLAIAIPISIAEQAYQRLTGPQLKASGRKGRLSSSSKNIRRMNALEDDIIRIRQEYGTADLVGGFSALRELTPYLSRVSHPSALRTRATLEENLAWFATHLGLATTAYKHASAAMEYRRKCYDGSFGNRSHLAAYASSGLIASNSLLISYRPRDATSSYRPLEAVLILNDVYQAKAAAGEDLGSEWFRQLATALLQHGGHDSLVRKLYDKAGQELEKNSDGYDLVTIQMNRERQQNFLDPRAGWERALDLIAETKKKFGS